MSQVGEAFVVVRPVVSDFRGQVAASVNRQLGAAAIPLPVTPAIARGSTVTWERLATGGSVPKVIPLPVQPTITPAARQAFSGEVGGLRGALLGGGQFAASRALGISGLAAGLFVFGKAAIGAVKSAASLEQELNVFQQVSGASADQMARVRAEARRLGADISLPAVSAGDAAATMTELAKAGLTVDQVLSGTRGTLQLSTAANLDFASSAELAATALNAFELPGTQATKVADLLAGAANAAQGDIADFGLGLQQVAAVAHQAGLTVQETVTFLTEFAKAGIAGSDAGTSLRVALLRLIAPTAEAKKIFGALGVDLEGFQAGRVRAPEFFLDLQRKMAPLSRETRNAALATIFGTDAIRVASIAVKDAGPNWDTFTGQVTRSGQAEEAARARTKGLSGQVSALGSNLDTLGTQIGTVAIPALTELTKALNIAVTGLENFLTDESKSFKSVFGPVIGVVRSASTAVNEFNASVLGIKTPKPSELLKGFAGAGDRSSPQFDKAAEAAGARVGKTFVKATANAITKNEQSVINAARKTVRDAQTALRDVVAEGARAVEAAAVDAKQNLTSIGQDLASQVTDLLDAGPLAQQIEKLQARLDRSQAGLQRTTLRRDLRDARDELARAEASITPGAGQTLTADQQRGLQEFLRPFRQKVGDAKAALEEFNTQGSLVKLQNRLEAQKTRIQKTLDGIIAKFNAGLLSAPAVNAQVAALLQKNVGPMATAGRAQGFAFRQAFVAQVAALQAQVAAIVGGPQTTNTGAEPAIVSPAAAAAQAAGNVAAAQRSVKDAIVNLQKAQPDAIAGPKGTNDLLAALPARIAAELRGTTGAKPSSAVKGTGEAPRPRTGGR